MLLDTFFDAPPPNETANFSTPFCLFKKSSSSYLNAPSESKQQRMEAPGVNPIKLKILSKYRYNYFFCYMLGYEVIRKSTGVFYECTIVL